VNDLIPFEYSGRSVRAVLIDGDPWFVAREVCSELDIVNVSDAVSTLDDDEKGVVTTDTLGGPQQIRIVSEAGLYSLILRSRKPEAKAFKRWVTHEVLPAIRQTGRYEVAELSEIEMARRYVAALEDKERLQAKVIEQAPLVAAEEHHRSSHGLKAVGDFANDLKAWAKTNHPGVKVKHQDVWAHLARLGMVIRGDTVRHNQPTAKAVEQGWCVPKVSDYDTSEGARSSTTTRLTPKGEGYAWDRITAYVEANGTLELPRRIGPVAS
jgi:anti-repressor protein